MSVIITMLAIAGAVVLVLLVGGVSMLMAGVSLLLWAARAVLSVLGALLMSFLCVCATMFMAGWLCGVAGRTAGALNEARKRVFGSVEPVPGK